MPVIAPIFDLAMPAGLDAAGVKAGLRASCHGEPLWAIKQTTMAFVTGRIGSCFCPNSAEFGKAVRLLTDPIREERARASRERKAAEQVAEYPEHQPLSESTRDRAERFIEESRLIADQERMRLVRASSGADLSQYYRHPPEPPPAYKPLTPEDLKDVPDAPPRKSGFKKMGTAVPRAARSAPDRSKDK